MNMMIKQNPKSDLSKIPLHPMMWRPLCMALLTLGFGFNSQAQTVNYIHTDGLGSPVAKSNASGNLIANSRTRYEPYGMEVAGTAIPTIGFTGHVNDADTGLTYMQQRYFDPVAGRFLSTDPVLTDANSGKSFNRYLYAENSPYKYIDPDGREVRVVGSDEFKKTVNLELEKIGSGKNGRKLLGEANGTKQIITIKETRDENNATPAKFTPGTPQDTTINHNTAPVTLRFPDEGGDKSMPAFVSLAHELGHAVAIAKGEQSYDRGGRPGMTPKSEIQSVKAENGVRKDHGMAKRGDYYHKDKPLREFEKQ